MDIAEKVCQEVRRLPEPLARQVLDFISLLEAKPEMHEARAEYLVEAQTPIMNRIWNNPDDEVWNDL
jgi:hypothetical protein